MTIADFAARLGLSVSHAQTRRAVYQGGVKLDGDRVEDAMAEVPPGKHQLTFGRNSKAGIVVGDTVIIRDHDGMCLTGCGECDICQRETLERIKVAAWMRSQH